MSPRHTDFYTTCVPACCSTASLSSAASCSSSCRMRSRRAAVAPHAVPRTACTGCWQPGACARAPGAPAAAPQAGPHWPWHPNPEPPGFRCRASPPQRAQAALGVSRDVSRTVTFGWLHGSSLARVASTRRSCRVQRPSAALQGSIYKEQRANPQRSCKSHFSTQMFASIHKRFCHSHSWAS